MEEYYERLLSTVPGVVYVLDEKGNFTYLSDALQSALGYSSSDLLGSHFSRIIHPDDIESVSRLHVLPRFNGIATGSERAPKLFDERRASPRKTSDLQVRLKARSVSNSDDDLVLICKVNAAGQYKNSDGKSEFSGTLGLIYDIAQDGPDCRTKKNAQKYNVLDLLSQALSHAFSNVFTGIYGNLQLIEMHLDGNDAVTSNVEAIKNSIEKAVVLIKQMKQIISDVSLQKENIYSLVTGVAGEVFSEADIDYKCTKETDLWNIEPDPDYIRNILRSVFYFIHHNMGKMSGVLSINLSNFKNDEGKLPRFDCRYVKVEISLPESALNNFQNSSQAMDECSGVLQKISAMALSYSLLKKTGAVIDVTYSEKPSIALYIPAIENEKE